MALSGLTLQRRGDPWRRRRLWCWSWRRAQGTETRLSWCPFVCQSQLTVGGYDRSLSTFRVEGSDRQTSGVELGTIVGVY